MARVFDVDPVTRTTELFHYDHTNDSVILEQVQDVTDIAETNKALYAMTDERAGWKGDGFHRVASIPLTIYFDLQRKGILDDEKAFMRWLNDNDNRVFRTRPGTV